MKKKYFTYDEIKELIYLYENNISISDIAYYFSKNSSTIHRVISKTKSKRKTIEDLLMKPTQKVI